MGLWLIDTSVLIDQLRGDARATKLLIAGARSGHEFWSSTVVRTEILAGMRPREEPATFKLLAHLHWQDVSVDLADRAGELARRYLCSHPGVDTIDYLIAATAIALGAELKTQNVKHFPMLDGLAPAYR